MTDVGPELLEVWRPHPSNDYSLQQQIGQKLVWACEVTSHLVPYWLAAFIHLSCSCCVSPDFWFKLYVLMDYPSRIIFSWGLHYNDQALISNGLVHNLDFPPTHNTTRIEHEVQLLPGICIATGYGLVHLILTHYAFSLLLMGSEVL